MSETTSRSVSCCVNRVGVVISTTSTDFPHVVFCGMNLPPFLFPQSLYFVENRSDLSKAQKSKFNSLLTTGERIEFFANRNNVIISYQKCIKVPMQVKYTSSAVYMQDNVIISPTFPRQCWSLWTSRCIPVGVGTELMDVVPNIVYEAFLAVNAYVDEPSDDTSLPVPHVKMELSEILRPVFNLSLTDNIFIAKWNLPDRRKAFSFFDEASDVCGIVKAKFVKLPRPPSAKKSDALLYVMDNRELIWPLKPFRKVVMGCLSSKNDRKILVEGRSLRANMHYCKFNEFYVVNRYRILSKNPSSPVDFPALMTRKNVATDNAGFTEYFVEVTPSNFRGFYVCHELRNCLIDDPKLLIFELAREHVKILTWVRLNQFGTVARFSVTAVHESIVPRPINNLIIESTGFIGNLSTGSVFCANFPTLRFHVILSSRCELQIGEYLEFRAIYVPFMEAFMIFRWWRVKGEFPEQTVPYYRGFIFPDTLNCTTVRACADLYESRRYGLVTDTEKLVWTKANAERIEMPTQLKVYLKENEKRRRATFFDVYALFFKPPASKITDLDERLHCPPTNKWWKLVDRTKCSCKELEELCREICRLMDSASMINEFSPQLCQLVAELKAL